MSISFAEKAGIVPITITMDPNHKRLTCELQAPQPLTILSNNVNISIEQVAQTLTLSTTDIHVATHTPVVASVGLPFLMVRVNDVPTLQRIQLNVSAFAEIARQVHTTYLHVYTILPPTPAPTTTASDTPPTPTHGGTNTNIQARMFAPLDNITEDPATGSANAALVALLTSFQSPPTSTTTTSNSSMVDETEEEYTWTIQQGIEMGRPSTIYARTTKQGGTVTGVWVKGSCVMVCEGWMEV
jgi:trans-2,3-dihydro-3-hydroxyanthranilate isomerase